MILEFLYQPTAKHYVSFLHVMRDYFDDLLCNHMFRIGIFSFSNALILYVWLDFVLRVLNNCKFCKSASRLHVHL